MNGNHDRWGRLLAWCCLLALTGCGGCGGGSSSSGGSFAKQYEQASNEKNPERKAQLFIKLADNQRKAKDTHGAKQTLNDATMASREVEDPLGRANLFRRIARVQARVDNRAGAGLALNSARGAAANIQQAEFHAKSLCDIGEVEGYWLGNASDARGTIEEAEKLSAKVEDVGGRVAALAHVGWAYGRSDLVAPSQRAFQAAFDLATTIDDPSARCRALLTIAAEQNLLEEGPAAQATLAKARAAADQIQAEYSRATKMADIAVQLAKAGERNEALKLLEQADEVARQEKDIHFSGKAIEYVAKQRSEL